jgi:lysophospholipase L1-like esterase
MSPFPESLILTAAFTRFLAGSPCRLLPLFLPLVGCTAFGSRPCSVDDGAEILVVGDSILAWNANNCASAPDVLGTELDRPVQNASVSGATMSVDGRTLFRVVPEQYTDGGWDWVVAEGGINDLNGQCSCADCADELDRIVSADGSVGEMPELVDLALADGARVALVAYYDMSETAKWDFGLCRDWADQLEQRYRLVAESRMDVIFVDPAQVINPVDNPTAYDSDEVHPSEEGSELLGVLLAQAIRAEESID